MEPVTLGVLAGGRSVRMGRDKATLPFGDGTLLEHVVRRHADGGPVLVSTRPGAPAERLGFPVVHDPVEDGGPFPALGALLARCETPLLLVVCCDQPFLPTDLAARLGAFLTPARDGVLLRSAHRLEAFPCLLRRRLAGPVAAHAAAGARKANAWTAVGSAATPGVEEALGPDGIAALRSLNRPSDYDAARPGAAPGDGERRPG
jgi:molybdopterin-guanine dinucleotide biosynthesis protein A